MTCECDCLCTCGKCNPNPDCNMSCLKRFEIALDTRNFEINLFWKRSNYFLVLNTAIAVGFVSLIKKDLSIVKDMESYIQALVLCFIGVVVCIIWFKVNLGSKYWQSYWEQNLDKSANNMKLCFFTVKTDKIVKRNLWNNRQKGQRACWEDPYDRLVLQKPSVSKCMTFLSLFFLAIWILVGLFISCYLGYIISCHLDFVIPFNKFIVYPSIWIIIVLCIVRLAIPKLIYCLCPQKKNNSEVK